MILGRISQSQNVFFVRDVRQGSDCVWQDLGDVGLGR